MIRLVSVVLFMMFFAVSVVTTAASSSKHQDIEIKNMQVTEAHVMKTGNRYRMRYNKPELIESWLFVFKPDNCERFRVPIMRADNKIDLSGFDKSRTKFVCPKKGDEDKFIVSNMSK